MVGKFLPVASPFDKIIFLFVFFQICFRNLFGMIRPHGCDAGEETVYLEMPCAMTTAKEIGQLRMPSIAGIRAAEDADVRVVSAADVHADPARCGLAGSPTQVVRSFVPDRDQTCETIEGTASEQAAKLAKIIEGMA